MKSHVMWSVYQFQTRQHRSTSTAIFQILATMMKNVARMEGWGSRADSGSLQPPQFLGSSMCGYILKQCDAVVFQVSAARGKWNELGLSRKGSAAPSSRRDCRDLARGMIWTH